MQFLHYFSVTEITINYIAKLRDITKYLKVQFVSVLQQLINSFVQETGTSFAFVDGQEHHLQ